MCLSLLGLLYDGEPQFGLTNFSNLVISSDCGQFDVNLSAAFQLVCAMY